MGELVLDSGSNPLRGSMLWASDCCPETGKEASVLRSRPGRTATPLHLPGQTAHFQLVAPPLVRALVEDHVPGLCVYQNYPPRTREPSPLAFQPVDARFEQVAR